MPAARPPTPDPSPLVALADRCVQCGLCLPACPTYGRDRLEAESPRGRIALARALALGTVPPTAVADAHLDHCLGCRSCEAVCPAGVDYGGLLVAARSRQRERRPPPRRQRLIEALTRRPRLLGAALSLYRLAYPALPRAWRPLPKPPAPSRTAPLAPAAPAAGRAAVFVGCVAATYERPLREALARLAAAAGVALDTPAGQGCCGALHAHAGDPAGAAALAAANRAAFAGHATVLTLASGCHESLARSSSGARDALDFLAERSERLSFRATPQRVAVHLPCSQRNLSRSVPALRRLLARVPQLQTIELDAGYGCCGASGSQMLTDPARAADFRRPLLDQLAASGATVLLSANIGCRLHLAGGTRLPALHPLQFLADCLEPDPPA